MLDTTSLQRLKHTHMVQSGTYLVQGSNFGRMPFQMPPVARCHKNGDYTATFILNIENEQV